MSHRTGARTAKRERSKLDLIFKFMAGLGIILGLGFLVLFVFHRVSIALVEVQTVAVGQLEESARVPAILLKRERVMVAPATGRLENMVPEGERVKNGREVARFYPEGAVNPISILIPSSGIVSFDLDGWETKQEGFSLKAGDQDIFEFDPMILNDGSFQFNTGEPILKVIDNLAPLRLAILMEPAEDFDALKPGDKISLRQGEEDDFMAKCEEVWRGDGRQTAILSVASIGDELLKERRIEVDIISKRYRGIIVPAKSLVTKDEAVGVYRVIKGKVHFRQVEVEAAIEGKALVNGLDDGDRIVTTPGLVWEGLRYN